MANRDGSKNVGRKPDYTISAMMKINRDAKGRVGAGWTQLDGSIQVKLDPFVVLQGEANGGEGMFLTLYPVKDRAAPEKASATTPSSETGYPPENDGNDFPF